jgi:hypothetical protein
LPQQVGEAKLRVPPTRVCQILLDQFSEPESLVEFAHQDQAVIGSEARTLEADLERRIKGKAEKAGFVSHPLGIHLRNVFITFTRL